MQLINHENLILEREAFSRSEMEKRMLVGGFNSLSKFELFVWDLEVFLKIQKKLGDRIILKGGAATQFYIPISSQRTSIDIDMICLASRDEVHAAIREIEKDFDGVGEYCKLKLYSPKNPKLGLAALETYYMTVPSECSEDELFATRGKQQVKIEFLYSEDTYTINRIHQPELFALETGNEFNILSFEDLFADKLTTLGPNTIGIPEERSDEQVKQVYDVITLFLHNYDQLIEQKQIIQSKYEKVARTECVIHNMAYDSQVLLEDMKLLIGKFMGIESDDSLQQRANDFQSLYLRRAINRDQSEWAIVGYQLEMLINFIFFDNLRITHLKRIEDLIRRLRFEQLQGPERGKRNREVRDILSKKYVGTIGLTTDVFRKRPDRMIWELVSYVDVHEIEETLGELE